MYDVTRRDFLRNSSLAATAALGGGWTGGTARAIEPIARNGMAKFKFSLAAYSYRDLFSTKKGDDRPPLTLFDFVDDCTKWVWKGPS